MPVQNWRETVPQQLVISKVQTCSLTSKHLWICNPDSLFNRPLLALCFSRSPENNSYDWFRFWMLPLQHYRICSTKITDVPREQVSQVQQEPAICEKTQSLLLSAKFQRRPCWGRQSSSITSSSKQYTKTQFFQFPFSFESLNSKKYLQAMKMFPWKKLRYWSKWRALLMLLLKIPYQKLFP